MVPFLFFFLPEDGTGISADRLSLEESGDSTIIVDVVVKLNNWRQ